MTTLYLLFIHWYGKYTDDRRASKVGVPPDLNRPGYPYPKSLVDWYSQNAHVHTKSWSFLTGWRPRKVPGVGSKGEGWYWLDQSRWVPTRSSTTRLNYRVLHDYYLRRTHFGGIYEERYDYLRDAGAIYHKTMRSEPKHVHVVWGRWSDYDFLLDGWLHPILKKIFISVDSFTHFLVLGGGFGKWKQHWTFYPKGWYQPIISRLLDFDYYYYMLHYLHVVPILFLGMLFFLTRHAAFFDLTPEPEVEQQVTEHSQWKMYFKVFLLIFVSFIYLPWLRAMGFDVVVVSTVLDFFAQPFIWLPLLVPFLIGVFFWKVFQSVGFDTIPSDEPMNDNIRSNLEWKSTRRPTIRYPGGPGWRRLNGVPAFKLTPFGRFRRFLLRLLNYSGPGFKYFVFLAGRSFLNRLRQPFWKSISFQITLFLVLLLVNFLVVATYLSLLITSLQYTTIVGAIKYFFFRRLPLRFTRRYWKKMRRWAIINYRRAGRIPVIKYYYPRSPSNVGKGGGRLRVFKWYNHKTDWNVWFYAGSRRGKRGWGYRSFTRRRLRYARAPRFRRGMEAKRRLWVRGYTRLTPYGQIHLKKNKSRLRGIWKRPRSRLLAKIYRSRRKLHHGRPPRRKRMKPKRRARRLLKGRQFYPRFWYLKAPFLNVVWSTRKKKRIRRGPHFRKQRGFKWWSWSWRRRFVRVRGGLRPWYTSPRMWRPYFYSRLRRRELFAYLRDKSMWKDYFGRFLSGKYWRSWFSFDGWFGPSRVVGKKRVNRIRRRPGLSANYEVRLHAKFHRYNRFSNAVDWEYRTPPRMNRGFDGGTSPPFFKLRDRWRVLRKAVRHQLYYILTFWRSVSYPSTWRGAVFRKRSRLYNLRFHMYRVKRRRFPRVRRQDVYDQKRYRTQGWYGWFGPQFRVVSLRPRGYSKFPFLFKANYIRVLFMLILPVLLLQIPLFLKISKFIRKTTRRLAWSDEERLKFGRIFEYLFVVNLIGLTVLLVAVLLFILASS